MPAFLPSELPVRAIARHHWIVLFRLPHRWAGLTFLGLVLLAWVWPAPFAWLLGAVLVFTAVMRWRLWKADRIYVTGLRVIEVSGVPELTRSERFLRLDRIAGAEIIESAWGSLLGYATILLTAPGERVDVRKFAVIADPHHFYRVLRALALGEEHHYHPDEDVAGVHLTDPIPDLGHGDVPRDDGYRGGGDRGSWD